MTVPTPIHEELHRIISTGIIWKKDEDGTLRYLIAKRAPHKKVWPNKWSVPGGGLKVDDYLREEPAYQNEDSPQWYNAIERCLRREIREETGLEIEIIELLHDVAFIQPGGTPAMVFSYFCKYAGSEVTLDEDNSEYLWVTAKEAQEYDLIRGIEHEIMAVDTRLST